MSVSAVGGEVVFLDLPKKPRGEASEETGLKLEALDW